MTLVYSLSWGRDEYQEVTNRDQEQVFFVTLLWFLLPNNVIDRDLARHPHAALHDNHWKTKTTFYYLHN